MTISEADLMMVCNQCQGKRTVEDASKPRTMGIPKMLNCPACEGAGVILTPSGVAIRTLMNKINAPKPIPTL
jgi:DnaJ-class molecular chaperone